MSDRYVLTTIDKVPAEKKREAILMGDMATCWVPDDLVQQIADAPRCEHGMIDEHQYSEYEMNWGRQEEFVRDCDGAPELRALLDGLVNE